MVRKKFIVACHSAIFVHNWCSSGLKYSIMQEILNNKGIYMILFIIKKVLFLSQYVFVRKIMLVNFAITQLGTETST